ncbi:MAG: TRAP transporter large permease subunit [Actinomycetota bacterium]
MLALASTVFSPILGGLFGLDLAEGLAMIMFVVFMAMILTGYNVAFSFAATGVLFAFLGHALDVFDPSALSLLGQRWTEQLTNSTLLAVPLFVLMGAILERSGIAERLLTGLAMLMGPLRGGVAAAVVLVGTLLAAATGVVAATVIVMGLLSLPAMVRLGYDHKLATGAITASGTLAQMLPPSLVLILLAQQLGNGVGIIGLFAGALVPGLMVSLMYAGYCLIAAYIRPSLGPPMPPEERTLNGRVSNSTATAVALVLGVLLVVVILTFSVFWAVVVGVVGAILIYVIMRTGSMLAAEVLVGVIPTILLILGVLAAIFQGIVAPSEAGAIGVLGALLLGVLNWWFDRRLSADGGDHIEVRWRLTGQALREAGQSTANITILVLTLIFASTFFSLMFRELGGNDKTSEWLQAVGGGKFGFTVVAMIAVFLLGINLEFLEITFIVVPIFVPAMVELGFTEKEFVWFAVLMALNLNIAFISPPVGFSLFYLQSVAPPEVKTADIHKGALPFMALQCVALVILAAFPQITEFSFDLFINRPSG